ncbi:MULTISPECIES: aldo/keto reductase [unclassified Aliivibrio]|uniref:aldo/keto reductase n=1 Tax=unclassified Aliivibrio TaxID=2645654 RepID=UPI00080E31A0|nr:MULTISPECIES: aldo/keto reductase [unclassified Aliivibrio]OCH15086.1 aldo/keto reductase [Aliivibrio sp. 1S128]OCH16103.1 aldo/keto reductase [Aliivibrio sp. 1S165]OCH26855.1 aldo/keto reductase [Aliivibrio sp. 1S175]
MEYSTLGSSNLSVSRICLGSMTWGQQNSQEDANQQIDYALSQGINFIDTAEMYAVPPSPDTYGKTETIIGNWLAANPERRKEIVLATKIAGPGLPWVRNAGPITGEAIIAAVDASLKRLQTDYIDLYQLHWPNRTSPHFGKQFPNQFKFSDFDAKKEEADMLEILQALNECIKAGKIHHIGLSDDTPWGINTYLKLSAKYDLPRMVSIQNEFSLLHAKDWPYLIENCLHEDVAYLPWSPLAGGMLSGKYLDGKMPEGSRWTYSQRNGIFRDTPAANEAVKAYMEVAKKHGYTPCQLALAWCDQIDGVTSTIIGATSLEQLKEDIDAFSKPLNDEVLADVNTVFRKYPMPF